LRSIAFFTALIGFGAKAGIVPLHVWLPYAHPAAPSHVSALMSGVMIKTAIYGLIRVYFDFMGGEFPWWWGFTLLVAGHGVGAPGCHVCLDGT
jgi:hydrogenase-4 component B